jgi:hypothetical protein
MGKSKSAGIEKTSLNCLSAYKPQRWKLLLSSGFSEKDN